MLSHSSKIHWHRGFARIRRLRPMFWPKLIREKMLIELGHITPGIEGAEQTSPIQLRAMVCESVGPIRHEVSVPFHDSQVRGTALLIQTGWDRHWGTPAYLEPGPFLGEHLIFRMRRSGVKLVGVDFPVNPQSTETQLITTGRIPIVENLHGLSSLPRVGFRVTMTPWDTAPGIRLVRTFAEITS
jgi:kynurenine formamidase